MSKKNIAVEDSAHSRNDDSTRKVEGDVHTATAKQSMMWRGVSTPGWALSVTSRSLSYGVEGKNELFLIGIWTNVIFLAVAVMLSGIPCNI